MPDESNQHGPRVDEALGREVEGLVRGGHDEGRDEGRRQQAPGPGEHEWRASRPTEPASGAMSDDDLDERSHFAGMLADARYPATAEELRATAESNGAGDEVLARLAALPDDRRFATAEEAWEASGGVH